jgi:DNA polymerase-3 subunit epsilon
VLSIGWVPVDGRAIMLAGARRVLVSDGEAVGPSATIHGLTDDVLSGGSPLESALAALLHDLAGRALLAHFARIETGFLSYACQRIWGEGLACAVVDTFVLERRALQAKARGGRWQSEPEQGALRLWTARERRGLPVYRAHEALTDALACAELYLAQRSELAARSPTAALTLRDLT